MTIEHTPASGRLFHPENGHQLGFLLPGELGPMERRLLRRRDSGVRRGYRPECRSGLAIYCGTRDLSFRVRPGCNDEKTTLGSGLKIVVPAGNHPACGKVRIDPEYPFPAGADIPSAPISRCFSSPSRISGTVESKNTIQICGFIK